jgi:hypothetical protein
VVYGTIACGVLAWGGYGIYQGYNHYHGLITGVKWGGIGLGGVAIFASIVATLYFVIGWMTDLGVFDLVGRGLCAVGRFIGRSFMGIAVSFVYRTVLLNGWRALCVVGRFIQAGDHAIKYRTCPMIQITED